MCFGSKTIWTSIKRNCTAEKSALASHGHKCKKHTPLRADVLVSDSSLETAESILGSGKTVESIIDPKSSDSLTTEEEYLADFSHCQPHIVSRVFMPSYKYINAIISIQGSQDEIIWLWGKIHIVDWIGTARMLIGMNILKPVNAVVTLTSSGNNLLRINGVPVPSRSSRQRSPPVVDFWIWQSRVIGHSCLGHLGGTRSSIMGS